MIEPTCQIKRLDRFVAEYPVGFFVEVGASDGKKYSNTYHLAEAGWKGIYIEPVSHLVESCINNHKDHNVTVIECAISNYNGEIEMYCGSDLYTANKNILPVFDSFKVPCFTLDTLLKGLKIDLLVIDVEFHEKEVLEGFTLDEFNPKIVIIEAHEKNRNKRLKPNVKFINDYFSKYKKVYSDTINNIYVR